MCAISFNELIASFAFFFFSLFSLEPSSLITTEIIMWNCPNCYTDWGSLSHHGWDRSYKKWDSTGEKNQGSQDTDFYYETEKQTPPSFIPLMHLWLSTEDGVNKSPSIFFIKWKLLYMHSLAITSINPCVTFEK